MLTYEAAKASYEDQINALLENDWKTLQEIFHDVNHKDIDTHHSCWSLTGKQEHSLFANLPFSLGCLTQIKRYPGDDHEGWISKLDIMDNKLIPINVEEDTTFSEVQLREFSKLQLQARYPEETV